MLNFHLSKAGNYAFLHLDQTHVYTWQKHAYTILAVKCLLITDSNQGGISGLKLSKMKELKPVFKTVKVKYCKGPVKRKHKTSG